VGTDRQGVGGAGGVGGSPSGAHDDALVAPLTSRLAVDPVTVDLGAAFDDPDGDAMVFRAASVGDAVRATVSGSQLTLTPLQAGSARVIVSASDGRGGRNFTSVPVEVASPCPGDCNRDGEVAIDELTLAIRAALGAAPVEQCMSADADGDGQVAVDELIAAVRRALSGCDAAG